MSRRNIYCTLYMLVESTAPFRAHGSQFPHDPSVVHFQGKGLTSTSTCRDRVGCAATTEWCHWVAESYIDVDTTKPLLFFFFFSEVTLTLLYWFEGVTVHVMNLSRREGWRGRSSIFWQRTNICLVGHHNHPVVFNITNEKSKTTALFNQHVWAQAGNISTQTW